MLNPYELGMIVSRIALTDQIFVKNILEAAENAGPKILPNDLENSKYGWNSFEPCVSSLRVLSKASRIRSASAPGSPQQGAKTARALCCERKIPPTLKTVSGRTKPNGGSDGWTGSYRNCNKHTHVICPDSFHKPHLRQSRRQSYSLIPSLHEKG